MLVTLLPRPHRERGSRFVVDGVAIVPLSVLRSLMVEVDAKGGESFDHYMRQRQNVLVESNSANDFSMMLVIALNEGENKLPEDMKMMARLMPLEVHSGVYPLLKSLPNDYDWETNMRVNIRDDFPSRPEPSSCELAVISPSRLIQ